MASGTDPLGRLQAGARDLRAERKLHHAAADREFRAESGEAFSTSAGLISSSSRSARVHVASSRDWCLERAPRDHRRSSMSPPDDIVVKLLSPICNIQFALHCTGIGLWEVTGHRFITKAALEDPKGPSRGHVHEDGRAATCNGASGRPCCAS